MILGVDASRAFGQFRTGTENYSYHLICEFAKLKSKHTFRLYQKDNLSQKWPENFETKIISWPRLWTQGGLAWECLKFPPDVLFIPAHTLPILHRLNLKMVVTIHDLGAEFLPEYHDFPQKIYLNWSTGWAVKLATKIIAVSEATKKDLIQKLGANEGKIKVVWEGVDHQNFKFPIANVECKKVIEKYKLKNPFILFVGTIQPRKNVERLIRAFSKVLTKQKKLDLALVGKKGWLADEVFRLPKKLGIEEKVKFLGYVGSNEIPALYNAASIFCLPSHFEGFGLPILEAFSCGCPVITSNISSMPEVAGGAAILVNPKDENEIAEKILEILENEKLRGELKKKGLARAKEFSWEKCAKETLAVLEGVAGGKS